MCPCSQTSARCSFSARSLLNVNEVGTLRPLRLLLLNLLLVFFPSLCANWILLCLESLSTACQLHPSPVLTFSSTEHLSATPRSLCLHHQSSVCPPASSTHTEISATTVKDISVYTCIMVYSDSSPTHNLYITILYPHWTAGQFLKNRERFTSFQKLQSHSVGPIGHSDGMALFLKHMLEKPDVAPL